MERPLLPGEVSLDELERVFRDTPGLHVAAPSPQSKPSRARRSTTSPKIPNGAEKEETEATVASKSIRVSVDTLESLMTMVSELVLTGNQLLDIVRRHDKSEFKVPLQRLSNVTAELQDGVMTTRMQPIGSAWQKLPRVIRDLSAELGKDIELELHGADTELDRQVLERIKDPLTHMVRNSADHGLESRADRIAAGKPEKGIIRLSAHHEGGHIIIGVADDGRGLDIKRIKEKALANGLSPSPSSTRCRKPRSRSSFSRPASRPPRKITSVSGRGVGMDVVRNNIDQIGGSIDVQSVQGKGLSFTIKIPLTLAIVSALIVESGWRAFCHPAAFRSRARSRARAIRASHRAHQGRSGAAASQQAAAARPPQQPSEARRQQGDSREGLHRRHPGRRTDLRGGGGQRVPHRRNRGQADGEQAPPHRMFSGNTILGDGSVIMIIDPNGVLAGDGASVPSTAAAQPTPKPGSAAAEKTVSLLVFRAGSPEPKAVPLSLVTRLEEIDCQKIELSNGRHMVQYRGQLMPLIRVSERSRSNARAPSRFWYSPTATAMGSRGRRDRRHRRRSARH